MLPFKIANKVDEMFGTGSLGFRLRFNSIHQHNTGFAKSMINSF